ncbi:MAG: hypothetical protein RML36_10755 [Anaerolineae bacterium]|nr:hypothetical protein [Anaerolineae bacterium]MDW8099948.1 hypothetical protein [Anaerolineae bacterium]
MRIKRRQGLEEPIGCPYAVHMERLNGVLRDRLNDLTHKTHAFAKREQTWDAIWSRAGSRPTDCVPIQPCVSWLMAFLMDGVTDVGPRRWPCLTDHVWSWEGFLNYRH